MRRHPGFRRLLALAVLVLSVVLAGCATSGPATQVAAGSGPIAIQASDFDFKPNRIEVNGTGTVTLAITNGTGTTHNITVKDPAGKVIASVELPAKQTTTVTATLEAAGTYTFDCNKPLHATLGMTGRIVVKT